MLYLMTHHRVYKILQAEIDATVASSQASTTFDIVSDETLKGLPYLQAVVREGLRMHPPITDVVPKKVPAGGDVFTIDGKEYFFPGGTNISYNAWGLHHDKKIFGEDADCFRPERWLLDDHDETHRGSLNAMIRTSEMVFGYGKYQCLGKTIAWLEIRKAIFEVCHIALRGEP
jgi:cytochrome P450